jgi:hypothetical protein
LTNSASACSGTEAEAIASIADLWLEVKTLRAELATLKGTR